VNIAGRRQLARTYVGGYQSVERMNIAGWRLKALQADGGR